MPKVRNIIIFVGLAVALFAGYFFFLKPPREEQATLTSSVPNPLPSAENTSGTAVGQVAEAGNFLSLLLNVQTIKLNGAIFASPAFRNLHDSSIELVQDGTEGRPNPFAQLGLDAPSVSPPAPPAEPGPQGDASSQGQGIDEGIDEDLDMLLNDLPL